MPCRSGFLRVVSRLALGLGLGAAFWVEGAHASIFNRSCTTLRLLPKVTAATRPGNQFQLTVHELPRLKTTTRVIDCQSPVLHPVEVAAESLVYLTLLEGSDAGGLGFEVVATESGQAWTVGSLEYCMGPVGSLPFARLVAKPQAPFLFLGASSNPCHLVVKQLDPVQEARERARDEEMAAEEERANLELRPFCTIM